MARKKKRKAPPPPKRPATFKWVFDPDIPTDDLLEGRDLRPEGDLDEIVDSFVFMLEQGDYLVWEAVVCLEQELPLTKAQKRMLGKFRRRKVACGWTGDMRTIWISFLTLAGVPRK